MPELTFIRFCWFLKYLVDPESKGCLEKAKTTKSCMLKDASNLASLYGSHIDGIVYVKQIGLGVGQRWQGH